MSLPPRQWRVLIIEVDGRETPDQFVQQQSELPPQPRHGIRTVGGRDVFIDEISSTEPEPGTVGTIRAHPDTHGVSGS
jgi:hypothetical protein